MELSLVVFEEVDFEHAEAFNFNFRPFLLNIVSSFWRIDYVRFLWPDSHKGVIVQLCKDVLRNATQHFYLFLQFSNYAFPFFYFIF